MKSVGAAAAFAMEHKHFLVRYAWHLACALFLLLFSLGFAIYAGNSGPVVAVELSVTNKIVPLQKIVSLNKDQPANLSPAQWKQIGDWLKVMGDARKYFEFFGRAAGERRQTLLGYADFVLGHYNDLPKETKDDWRALQNMNWHSEPFRYDSTTFQQLFVSKTLTISELQDILSARSQCDELRSEIDISTTLVDRIVAVLFEKGLTIASQYDGPKLNLSAFVHRLDPIKLDNFIPTLPNIPPLNISFEQVLNQLAQPPLSGGTTSAERAIIAPSTAR